jgi:hypothetical protein
MYCNRPPIHGRTLRWIVETGSEWEQAEGCVRESSSSSRTRSWRTNRRRREEIAGKTATSTTTATTTDGRCRATRRRPKQNGRSLGGTVVYSFRETFRRDGSGEARRACLLILLLLPRASHAPRLGNGAATFTIRFHSLAIFRFADISFPFPFFFFLYRRGEQASSRTEAWIPRKRDSVDNAAVYCPGTRATSCLMLGSTSLIDREIDFVKLPANANSWTWTISRPGNHNLKAAFRRSIRLLFFFSRG